MSAGRQLRLAAGLGAISVFLVSFLHLFELGSTPPGFFIDESAIGYNAYSVAKTGADEYGTVLPLFFRSFDNYHEPVMVYTLVPMVSYFGLEKWVVRLPSAIFFLAAAVAFGFLAYEFRRNVYAAIAAATLFGLLPWGFPVSRVAMAGYTPMLLGMIIGLWSWFGSLRKRSAGLAVVSGVSWAFAMYAHNIGRPMTAVTLVCLSVAFGRLLWTRRRQFAAFVISYVLSLVPMMVSVANHPEAMTSRFSRLAVWRDSASILEVIGRMAARYLDYFSPSFLFLQGDSNLRHHTGIGGELYLALSPFVVVGLYAIIRHAYRNPYYRGLLLILAAYPAAAILTMDRMHSTRCINGAPWWCLVAVVGFSTVWRRKSVWGRRVVAAAGILVALEAGLYVVDYFGEYGERARQPFDAPFTETLERAFVELNDGELLYVSNSVAVHQLDIGFKPRTYAQLLFFGRVDPARYQKQGFAGDRIRPFMGTVESRGVLIRCDARVVPDESGALRVVSNTEPIPQGARLIHTVEVQDGLSFEAYRIPGPP